MRLSDFTYHLPPELIARYPLTERSASRLMCVDKNNGQITHKHFADIITLINPGDLLICNNSRVIPARLFGQKESGGKVEILVEKIINSKRVLAFVRASKSPKLGSIINFAENINFEVVQRHDNLFELALVTSDQVILDIIEKIGHIPLPPYFHREPEESDKERYQTVYAKHKGSVAAPTAGLHFDDLVMQQLQDKGVHIDYVTLHVGAGTFAPVRIENIKDHKMHLEYIEVSQALCNKIKMIKTQGGRIIAVGTTSARSLETAARNGEITAYHGDTDIFIYPGFQFNCVDALITNFHLPESTLLMLVSALAGYKNILQAYEQAVEQKYRFFSYGDAMFIS